jgi:hypothetical protein
VRTQSTLTAIFTVLNAGDDQGSWISKTGFRPLTVSAVCGLPCLCVFVSLFRYCCGFVYIICARLALAGPTSNDRTPGRWSSGDWHVCVCVSAPIYRTVRDHVRRNTRQARPIARESTAALYWQEESTAIPTHGRHTGQNTVHLDRSSLRRGPIQDAPPPKQPHARPDPRRKQQQPQYPHPPKCQAPSAQANHTEKRPTPQARRIHAGTSAIASTWGNAGGVCEAGEGSQGHHNGTPKQPPTA